MGSHDEGSANTVSGRSEQSDNSEAIHLQNFLKWWAIPLAWGEYGIVRPALHVAPGENTMQVDDMLCIRWPGTFHSARKAEEKAAELNDSK